ncbi:SDR family oxidoreductase [Paludibacterium sp.]|uniref:SDR family NAD(P)-dependent oxidoreductase n=1 Tax=Paludibacterium sp. TaxID=1917523 RepID=UPI0025EEA46F|nr:SDR family oxidoreductase [Paludibacterium sp.]MBV8649468.1 SDR family oxidoreductase [Paludibacterium sp.]
MRIDLSQRRAVVSGSTAGIGFAIAKGLAAAGAQVVINGRGAERVEQAVADLRQALPGARVEGVAADLGTAAGAADFLLRVPETDILINNLGIYQTQDFFTIDDTEWERFFQVNVLSAVRLSRHYAPGMAKRGWGRVQFISSESAVQPQPDMVHYGMSKTALLSVSRGLAGVLAGSGVTVNAVLPGPTHSEGVARMLCAQARATGVAEAEVAADFIRQQRPASLIRRLASADEVANMVVYLASEQASATSGAALRVDGGVWPSIL